MFLFVCWTPYQIFNAINFVLNNVENSRDNADIYIYHEFGDAEKISSELKKLGIFCHVYDVEAYDKGRVWYSKFSKIKRLLCPYITIKKYLRCNIDVRKQGYKTLVISGNNLFSVNLYNAIKDLQVYFIDDGIGSYFGDMRADDMTMLYRVFNKVFKRGPLSYDVKKIFVNNKAICKTLICENLCQLPALQSDSYVFKMIEKAFDYKINDYYQTNKFIYLSQPYFEVEEYIEGAEECVLDELANIDSKDNILIRIHPRQRIEQFQGWKLDLIRNLWELECIKQVTDTNVLLGGFSTTQFLPKILADKEPYVLFLYKLYYPREYTEKFDDVIELLQGLYTKPEKIKAPGTIEELREVLLQIKNNC